MARLPAKCTKCGLIQDSGFTISTPPGVKVVGGMFQGNFISCRSCGALAAVMDGQLDFEDDIVRVIRPGQFTLTILSELHQIAAATARGDQTPEQALRAVEKIAPKAKGIFKAALSGGKLALDLLVGALAVAAFMGDRADDKAQADYQERMLTELARIRAAAEAPAAPLPGLGGPPYQSRAPKP